MNRKTDKARHASRSERLQVSPESGALTLDHLQTPLVVMPESVGKDVEGTDENVAANDWICYYEDSDQFQRLLLRLLQ